MFGTIFSNFTSRKTLTAFGALFSNTTVVRYNNNGTEQQRFVVPCEMGQKEKYWQALQGDPNNDKKVSITLPQIAYTCTGLKYDAQRKQQTTIQNFNLTNNGLSTNYMWVPYNYDLEVYIYVRNMSDGFQIVEQILPFFTPDYTMIVNLIPSMNITRDIPLILNSVTYEVDNEGDRESESRFVMFTLSFTAKGYMFGPVSSGQGLIKEAIVNLWNWVNEDGKNLYLVLQPGGTGKYLPGETVYQDVRLESSNASAIVLDWTANTGRLLIDQVQGTFVTGESLTGVKSGAKWNIINYEIQPQILETITITPNPANANANSAYTYNVAIQTYNTAH